MTKLYRYQPINKYSLSSLESKKYWSAKPTTFNDPFEFKLRTPSEEDINTIKGLKEIRDLNPHLNQLTDFEMVSMAKQWIQKTIEAFGVVCFTETNDNLLMWSHYSSYHYGMCLGFEIEDTNSAGIYKVDYSQNYPDLDFGNLWHKDGMMKILWTKSLEWQYEKEWRLITMEGDKLEDYKGRLTEVIFGCRTSTTDKDNIRNMLKDDKVDFLNAVIDKSGYKINVGI
ncbi:DUF2971 domain-containing protein [Algoriphagus sp. SE2]|uniref:DUF2971 domain-containing protein n=1 Tax=Algoriphagus sp. SE2 TaxID=3141536 RepID=UPI0031CD7680